MIRKRKAQQRRLRLQAALAALVLSAASAAAQDSVVDMVREADQNGDGRLQKEEAPIRLLPLFDQIDRDRDANIDSFEAWEYDSKMLRKAATEPPPSGSDPAASSQPTPTPTRAPPPRTLVELVEQRDANGDGRVAPDEVRPSMRDELLRFDLDGSGFLELEEARKLDARRQQEQQAPQRRTLVRTVGLMDTNGDGVLQKKEAPLRVQRVFDRLDLDRDGAIDLDEARAADAAPVNPEAAR